MAAMVGPALEERLGAGVPLVAAGVALVVAGLGSFVRRRRGTLPLAVLAIGGAAVLVRLALAGTPAPPGILPDGNGPWAAVVAGIGSPRDGQQTATLVLARDGSERASVLRVAATLPRYPEVGPTDRVVVGGRLEPLPADDGGYGSYLRRIGVAATLRARTLERLGGDPSPAGAVEGLRRASGDALTRSLPEPEAGLAAGILIGLRDRVDHDLAAAFTTAGVSHVVAISGWNIAIVAAMVAAVLRRRLGRRGRSIATLVAIVAYTIAAGASPSVVRAAVMAAVALVARESGRAGAAVVALGWAVVLLLLADPATVADPGFQLSVLATAGLIAWATPITDRLRQWRGGRLPGWLAESLGISFAAEAAVLALPVVLAGFGRLAILAPVVNLIVVPLVPPAMAAGTVALVGGWLVQIGVPSIVATLFGLPGWLVLVVLVSVVRFAAALPFASVMIAAPWSTVAGVASGVIVILFASDAPRRVVRRWTIWTRTRPTHGRPPAGDGPAPAPTTGSSRRRRQDGRRPRPVRQLAVVVAICVVAVVLAAANRPDGRVRVTVLDVGQGDAIMVEGGRGGRLLVDGGPDPDRLLLALDARLPPWDRRIDLLVLTHPHEDHVAGLALLLDRYRVGRTFEPGMIGPGPGYRAWEAALDRLGLRPGRLSTGDRFDLDEIRFRVLWPDPGAVPREPADGGTAINNVSVVLLGEVGRERFLLAGDIEQEIDPILVGRGLPRVDLLKIAHHGSRTSSTGPFLDAVRPRVAVASAGAGNPYGHPTKATLDRVAARGAEVLRTDRNGSIEVTLDGATQLDVRPERRDAGAAATQPVGIARPVAAIQPPMTIVVRPRVAFACAIASIRG
jgi:competence protein ComEC